MSDNPRDFGQLSPASLAVQSAWEYADHVWLETLLKQRKEILGRSAQRVISEMDYMIEDGDYEITPQDIAEYTSWKESYAVEEAGWDAQLSALEQSHTQVAKAYAGYRAKRRKARLVPTFVIDPTEPEWRLQIQRQFAVEREARIICTNSVNRVQFEECKSTIYGRYYLNSDLPLKEPVVDLESECCAITDYLQKNYGNSPEEYESAYQDKEWLSENIARLARVRRNGRPLDDQNWEREQREMGYWLPEVVFMSIEFKKAVEKVRFYESHAINGQPRRLVFRRALSEESGDEGNDSSDDDRDIPGLAMMQQYTARRDALRALSQQQS